MLTPEQRQVLKVLAKHPNWWSCWGIVGVYLGDHNQWHTCRVSGALRILRKLGCVETRTVVRQGRQQYEYHITLLGRAKLEEEA